MKKTELKKLTESIFEKYNHIVDIYDIYQLLTRPFQIELTEDEIIFHRTELAKLGYTYEKCMAEPHEDIDEEYFTSVFGRKE